MKQLLKYPAIYQFYQELGGFFEARVAAIEALLAIPDGARVLDIGCGPGHIVAQLPENIDYMGLDIDEPSIAFAKDKFGERGRFEVRFFDEQAVRELGPVDIVMMNGVMHHIADEPLVETLRHVRDVLAPGGRFFSADGCYLPGQSRLAKWLLDNDRGEYVRDEAGYRQLLVSAFDNVKTHLRENTSGLPYSYLVGVAQKDV